MRKIWVIDDEELLSEIYCEVLREDFETEAFASASSVLKAIEAGREPDLFLSDIRMPGMTGIELLSEIRKRNISKPFLIISGFADKESAIEALSLGAFALIEKPFHPVQLRHAVSRASAYGELLDMTEGLISNYQTLLGSMGSLLEICRDRYISAENQLGAPVPPGDREKVLKYLSAILHETRLEEVTERTTLEIQDALARRERLKATVTGL